EARGLGRDGVRLLVTVPGPDWVVHASFVDLHDFLGVGDVVVVNDSATLPAAQTAVRWRSTCLPGCRVTDQPAPRRARGIWGKVSGCYGGSSSRDSTPAWSA